ncbi:uncharacterized protein Dana_GF12025, isoform B [Drosophila ananassae]|uniref:Uncharacterized protein, isoform B n=1 Tax=Drosophila ananassae TaxID=7217 RepID=B3MD03_DROAN|nr:uncharacterized protein LOC6494883 isoform X1 [Drosophila ananassae]EDV36318.2 uncharacterized protein Dana_GF12025, isoform B [Drosophila ananassae]
MLCRRCCYLVPLNIGCLIISGLFLSYHVGEVVTHTSDIIFLKEVAQYTWAPILIGPLYTASIISSMLLIYGACKQRKGFVLVWVIMHVPIFLVYLIMTICDGVLGNPPPVVIAIQVFIVVVLFYSIFIVLSYYQYLKMATHDTEEYEY